MPLDPTVGGATADTYASLAEANAYFASRPNSEFWTDADVADQEVALRMAARLLDSVFVWDGVVAYATQLRAFPRIGLVNRNGVPIPENVNPLELKEAQSAFAGALLATDRLGDDDIARQGITDLKAGPVSLSFKQPAKIDDDTLFLRGPDFGYVSRVVPDEVLMLIPSSWYVRKTLIEAEAAVRPMVFKAL